MKNEAAQMILEGTELEVMYARDTMPRGVLGMNASMMEEYLQFIANRRLTQIGLEEEFKRSYQSISMDVRNNGSQKRKRISLKLESSNIKQVEHLTGNNTRNI